MRVGDSSLLQEREGDADDGSKRHDDGSMMERLVEVVVSKIWKSVFENLILDRITRCSCGDSDKSNIGSIDAMGGDGARPTDGGVLGNKSVETASIRFKKIWKTWNFLVVVLFDLFDS